jgi:heme exporter protein CcmB
MCHSSSVAVSEGGFSQTMRRALRQFGLLLKKDLTIEWRSREVVLVGGLFSLVIVALFVFSGLNDRRIAEQAVASAIWVSLAFIGTVVFTRTIQRESEHQAMEQLMMLRKIAGPLYASKLTTNFLLLMTLEVPLLLVTLATFRIDLAVAFFPVLALLAAGTLGFSALGSVLAAALSAVRMREVLLPIVLFPLSIPLFIAGAQATTLLLDGTWNDDAVDWLMIILMFDIIFLTVSRWLFGEVVEPAA